MSNKNLELYAKLKTVPPEAQKKIGGGRLSGMTDINPMWRIKMLTETYGPCGIGWYYNINKQWIEEGGKGERAAFVHISLYVKDGDKWSAPIEGTGGSSLVTIERNGPYTSDECYKMALTDAISVSCKALGMGADIYYAKDRTKYDDAGNKATGSTTATNPNDDRTTVKSTNTGKVAPKPAPDNPNVVAPPANNTSSLSSNDPYVHALLQVEAKPEYVDGEPFDVSKIMWLTKDNTAHLMKSTNAEDIKAVLDHFYGTPGLGIGKVAGGDLQDRLKYLKSIASHDQAAQDIPINEPTTDITDEEMAAAMASIAEDDLDLPF